MAVIGAPGQGRAGLGWAGQGIAGRRAGQGWAAEAGWLAGQAYPVLPATRKLTQDLSSFGAVKGIGPMGWWVPYSYIRTRDGHQFPVRDFTIGHRRY